MEHAVLETSTANDAVGPDYFEPALPLAQLQPSRVPANPRKRFSADRLRELAASIQTRGIIGPLVVRRVDDHYEIICGERRFRAAALAGLTSVPVMVRCLTDTAALEVMVVENKQREDVDALEEADGFRRLLDTGYGIDTLAAQIGLSRKYVYDRMKLLRLIPEAQQLLTDGRITAGHAILLARLKPEDQARAIDPVEGGLFVDVVSYEDQDAPVEGGDPLHGFVPVSVREFDDWIDRHVRIDLAKPAESDEFPAIARAQEMAARVVSITHEQFLSPRQEEGASAAGDRILLAGEWKRADGGTLLDAFEGRKVTYPGCTQSLLGVIVIGRDRGTAFQVCIDRSCPVHWSKQERVAAQRDAESRAPRATDDADDSERGEDYEHDQRADDQQRQVRQQQWEAQKTREDAARDAYRIGAPAILAAFVARVKALKPGVLVLEVADGAAVHPKALAAFPKPKTAEDLMRLLAVSMVAEGLFNEYSAPVQVPLWAKRFGLDLKPLLKPAKTAVHTSARTKAASRKIAPQPKPKPKKKAGKGRR